MDELTILKMEVNAYLEKDNGTKFLNMAYEEVLYPVSFVGKKKYFGIAHENVINFRPKKLFIKGVESVKQGNSNFLVKFANEVMWRLMGLTNRIGMKTIIEEALTILVDTCKQKDVSEYTKSSVWKPDKKNITVHTFVRRMKAKMAIEDLVNKKLIEEGKPPNERLYRIPDVYERFNYVVTTTDREFDIQGKVLKTTIGDKMEYDTVVRAKNIPIDYSYYLEKQLITPAARFISYYLEFRPKGTFDNSEGQQKKLEDGEIAGAKKYLINYVHKLQGFDKKGRTQRGLAYKRVWKTVSQDCYKTMSAKLGKSVEMLNGEYVDWTIFMDEAEDYDAILASYMSCVDICNNTYIASNKPVFEDYFINMLQQYGLNANGDPISSENTDLYKLHQKYKTSKKGMGIYYRLGLKYEKYLTVLKNNVYGLLPELDIIARKYNYSLELLVEQGRTGVKNVIDIASVITESDKIALDKLHDLWNEMNTTRRLQYKNIYVDRNIEQLKNKRLKHQPIMDKLDIYKNIHNDAMSLKILPNLPNEFAL
jgi:hypothetical protein